MTAQFGLDIGSYSIKLIKSEKKGKNPRLLARGEIRTPAPLNSEAEKDKINLVEAIKKIVAETRVDNKEVILSLPEADVFTQIIELPYMSKSELNSALSFEAEQYIPVPLEEVQLEHLVLKTPPKGAVNEKMEILLVAAKKASLSKLVEVVEISGLTPIAIETEVLSLIRSLNIDGNTTNFIVDLGHRSTNLALISNGRLKFIRTLATGGEALTRAVSRTLNMDLMQSEQYKINYGIDTNHLEGRVAKAILPTLSIIIQEIKKGIAFFVQKFSDIKINNIILSGGGAEMPALSSYLAKQIGTEVLTADPFFRFAKDKLTENIPGKPRYSVAIGLSIRDYV